MIEVFIGANSLALVAGVLILARLAARIGGAADDVGTAARRVTDLTPNARALIETGHDELAELRSLIRTTAAVANDVRDVSGQASTATSHLVRGLESEVFARYRAVFAGARAGIGMLRRFRDGNGSRTSQPSQVEEFDHMKE
jgi:hypothetical protein